MSELKAINAHGVRKDDGAYYDRRQVDKFIDELDERHTTEITALEVSYRLQLDGLRYDKDAEIRRLKRALYKACANWADVVAFEETEGIGYDNSVAERWRKMESKCRAKAEEYK